MKQKDIAVIAVVVIVSMVIASLASKFILKPEQHIQKVEVVQPISSNFPDPDRRFFNKSSVDPTQNIQIGDNANADPFRGSPGAP